MKAVAPVRPADDLPALLDAATIRKQIIRIGQRTFWRWVASGTFPRPDISIGGKVRLWKRETVETWIDETARKNKG